MTKNKWQVIVFTESERLVFDTEEEADREAERQGRVNNAWTRQHKIEVEDEG